MNKWKSRIKTAWQVLTGRKCLLTDAKTIYVHNSGPDGKTVQLVPWRDQILALDVGIYVEGRWLKQLIAECVAKHQMLEGMQRRMTDTACAGLALMPQRFIVSAPGEEGKS